MRSSTLPALILFCLIALVWSATARAEHIEVHRMGGAPHKAAPRYVPPRHTPNVGPRNIPYVAPRHVPELKARRVRRLRIFEHAALDKFDDLVPVEPEEVPDDPEPEEEPKTEIESVEEIYDVLHDTVHVDIVLAGVGLAALLLRRRR
jgi:hypothetical protein